MAWYDFLTGSTPGAIVGDAGAKVVGGLFDGIQTIIKEFHLSPEDEMKFKLAVEQQKLAFYQAQTLDVQSARGMQMAGQSVWPGLISTIILVGFFGGGGYIIAYGLPANTPQVESIINMFAVCLIGGVSSVLGFWLGSSHGSVQKDQMLYRSTPTEKV